jgi:hypothetical protein
VRCLGFLGRLERSEEVAVFATETVGRLWGRGVQIVVMRDLGKIYVRRI